MSTVGTLQCSALNAQGLESYRWIVGKGCRYACGSALTDSFSACSTHGTGQHNLRPARREQAQRPAGPARRRRPIATQLVFHAGGSLKAWANARRLALAGAQRTSTCSSKTSLAVSGSGPPWKWNSCTGAVQRGTTRLATYRHGRATTPGWQFISQQLVWRCGLSTR